MFIIIGLGNPGTKFKNTRHNVGFEVADEICANFQFSIFNFQSKFNAEISQTEINGEKIILAKPQTFMNESGKSVRKLVTSYKLLVTNLIVINDDIDLPVGKIKIIKDRGSAGHKGVESIIKEIGTSDFIRIRIGIAPEKETKALNIVLKKFSKEEQELVNAAIKKASQALKYFLENGLEKTMNAYN